MSDQDWIARARDIISIEREFHDPADRELWDERAALLRAFDASEEARQKAEAQRDNWRQAWQESVTQGNALDLRCAKAEAQRDKLRVALEAQGQGCGRDGQWHVYGCLYKTHARDACDEPRCIEARAALEEEAE